MLSHLLSLIACTAPDSAPKAGAGHDDTGDSAADTADTADSPASFPLKIGIPAYFYPDAQWDAVVAAGAKAAVMIVNPDSGAGAAADPVYAEAITRAKNAGILVLGYVSTAYGDRAEAEVFLDIDNYANWYGVSGYFFDEVSGAAECAFDKKYYDRATNRAGTSLPGSYVAFNPGTDTCEYFLNIADVIVTFEDSAAAYAVWAAPDWTRQQPAARFWHLVLDTAESELASTLERAVANNVATVYVTDDVLDNPWDTLPSYWDKELAAIE